MKKTRLIVTSLFLVTLALTPALADEPAFGWSDLHDGGAGLLDEGVIALMDADGNAIVGGMRTDPDGPADILIRKLDHEDGSVLWTYTYVDPGGYDMKLSDIVIDHRGDLLVAGYLASCDS